MGRTVIGWWTEVAGDMVKLGGDVAGIKINDDGLHLQHIGCAGLPLLGDSARDDIDGSALAVGPCGKCCEFFGRNCERF